MNEQMMTFISNLKSTGLGHGGIPMFMFKDNAEVLSQVITHICSKSLPEGKFPSY